MHSPPTACSGGKIEVTHKSTSLHAGNLSLQNNPVTRAKKTQDKAHKAKSALCHDQLEGYRHKTNSLPRLRIRRTVTRTDLTMFSEIMALIDYSQCVFLTEHLRLIYSDRDRILNWYCVIPRTASCGCKIFLTDSVLNFLPKQNSCPQPFGTERCIEVPQLRLRCSFFSLCADTRIDFVLKPRYNLLSNMYHAKSSRQKQMTI